MKISLKSLLNAFVAFTSLNLITLAAQANDLKSMDLITEEYPPYNFKAKDKSVEGIAVDLLIAAAKSQGESLTSADISLRPWARGYRSAQTGPKVVLFSTTQTEERKPLFKWAGPITATRVVLMAKKSKGLKISGGADLSKLKVGAIRDDVGEQLVKALAPGLKIKSTANATAMIKSLGSDRIDVMAYEENVAKWLIRAEGMNASDYEAVYVLTEGQLYYTFSKDVTDDIVSKLQAGIDAVKANKAQYDAILAKYLK